MSNIFWLILIVKFFLPEEGIVLQYIHLYDKYILLTFVLFKDVKYKFKLNSFIYDIFIVWCGG